MLAIWGLLFLTLALFWYRNNSGNKSSKHKDGIKVLPGPKGLPLIGNLLDLGKYPHEQFRKWADQYGGIYKVKMGTFNQVIVADPKLSKELFNDPLVTGRFHPKFMDFWEDSPGLGIAGSQGDMWAVHRRFLLRHLRDFGFGKSSTESTTMEEVKELIEMFKANAGTPVGGIREKMRLAMVNTLWQMLTSQRFDQTDPRLIKLANNTSDSFNEVIAKGGLLIFLPWIRHIIPERSGYLAIRKIIGENREFLTKSIEEYKKTFDENEEPKDFFGVYLAEMKKHENDPTSPFHGQLAERQLATIAFDMFLAGSDTTATTTDWIFLYLCKFPHVQKKLQEEITEITGDTRHVSVTDRPNMPYTLAMIDETLRFSSLVPDASPHRVTDDMEFHGYFFPKDTMVQPSTYSIHYNKKIWGDPENFRPDRFLSEDGKKYIRNENLQAFNVGRRQCLGEVLARDNLFLFLTNIFQKFSIKFDPNEKEPTFDSEVGILRAPLPYKVVMTNRFPK